MHSIVILFFENTIKQVNITNNKNRESLL